MSEKTILNLMVAFLVTLFIGAGIFFLLRKQFTEGLVTLVAGALLYKFLSRK